jgi:hypothetical protein
MTEINLIPSDEPMVPFLVALDELERRSSGDSSTVSFDSLREDIVSLSDASFESG